MLYKKVRYISHARGDNLFWCILVTEHKCLYFIVSGNILTSPKLLLLTVLLYVYVF